MPLSANLPPPHPNAPLLREAPGDEAITKLVASFECLSLQTQVTDRFNVLRGD